MEWNDRCEIEGDRLAEAILEEMRTAYEGHRTSFEENLTTPEEKAEYEAWLDAPLSALVAREVAGDDPELFDQIKAMLKGE